MKKFSLNNMAGLLGLVIILGSCASSGSITKRRYSPGYQVSLNLFGKDKKQDDAATPPMKKVRLAAQEMAVIPTTIANPTTAEKNTFITTAVMVEPPAPAKVNIKAEARKIRTAVKTTAMGMKDVVKTNFAEIKPVVAATVKNIPAKMKKADDNQLIAAIVAFFIPFLGVLIYEGAITTHFWISLLLTLLFWLPGVIYAWMVIFGAI